MTYPDLNKAALDQESMALYYFHLEHQGSIIEDFEGAELPELETARKTAIRGARGLLGDELASGSLSLSGRIDIADSEGRVLATVPFTDAVHVSGL